MKPGFPNNAVTNANGELIVDGITIYEYLLRYSERAIKYRYESLEMQRLHMQIDIFFHQVQTFNANNGIPLLNRTTICDGINIS